MCDTTKQHVREKLSKITIKIGFPDKWSDYTGSNISSDKEYWENVLELYKFYANENVIPAGILQEPFYSSTWSLGKKLGGIGAIIAPEITHSFVNI
jgi:putative endopeptidase